MGIRKSWWSLASLTMALAFMLSFHSTALAASYTVHLSGSGPVYTSAFSPGAWYSYRYGGDLQQPECRL